MASHSTHGAHADHAEGHAVEHPTPRTYYIIFGWLMALLVVTVVMYYVDLSVITHWVGTNVIVALIIAVVKASLVVLFFMNVKGSTRLTWLWAGIGFVWLLLMSGIFMDYLSRPWLSPSGWTP